MAREKGSEGDGKGVNAACAIKEVGHGGVKLDEE